MKVSIQLHPEAALQQFQREILKSVTFPSIALAHIDEIPNPLPGLPDVPLSLRPTPERGWTPDGVRPHYQRWLLTSGFRDAIEALNDLLESCFRMLTVWKLIGVHNIDITVSSEQWKESIEMAPKRFHREGLPKKITALRADFGLAVPSKLIESAVSINSARNCFVHRQGIVGQQDVDGTTRIVVQWFAPGIAASGPKGVREVCPPAILNAGETLQLRRQWTSKEFAIGDEIIFSPSEFSGICWSLLDVGRAYAANVGTLIAPPDASGSQSSGT